MTENSSNEVERWQPPANDREAVERLRSDLKANPGDTEEAIANRYLQSMYPAAVLELGRLAWYAESDRERLSAALRHEAWGVCC